MQFNVITENERSIRYRIKSGHGWLSFADVFEKWQGDEAFRSAYIATLANCKFPGYFWEHPGLLATQISAPYEFVLHRNQHLDRMPIDPHTFGAHFAAADQVAIFPNLGRNAILLAPTPVGENSCYKHMAAFLRSELPAQQHCLFEKLGDAMKERLEDERPVWLSTAGMGVAWLHVRLDDQPKYYRTRMYRDPEYIDQEW